MQFVTSSSIPPSSSSSFAPDDFTSKRVVIDSRDRDLSRFPSPAEYDLELDDEMVDVESVQLLVADVPFSGYMVNLGNRLLHARIGGGQGVITSSLTIGDYVDGPDLALEVAAQLNRNSPDAGFQVTYVPRTDNFRVSAAVQFDLVFVRPPAPVSAADAALADWERPPSPPPVYMVSTAARLLGFGCGTYTASPDPLPGSGKGTWSVLSPFRKNFSAQPYLVLRCEPAKLLTSSNDVLMDAFALLPPNQDRLSFAHRDENSAARKTFRPIIPKLRRLRIRFLDYDGFAYDFQNRDHRLELLFKSSRSGKYRRYDV